jgi:WD40 repeat protein
MVYRRPIVRIQKLHEYWGHKAPVFSLCNDKQGIFYSASGDGLITKWDSQSLSDGKAVFQAHVPFYAVALIRSHILASGASDGSVYFYHLKNKLLLKSVAAHLKSVFQILEINENYFITIGGDGILNIWDSESLTIIHSYIISTENLRTVLYEPQNQWLIIGSSDSKIRVLEFLSMNIKVIKEWKAHQPSVFSLVLTKKYPFLISAGRDASIRVWDYQNAFELVQEIPAHIQTINHLALSPDESYLLSASMDKLIKLWDIQNEFKLIKVIDKNRNDSHTASINHLLWLEYNDSIISCSDDKKIIQWAIDINPQEKE